MCRTLQSNTRFYCKMFVATILILTSFAAVKSANILVVVPTPAKSHQIVFRPLIQELIRRDYNVTVINVDPIYPYDKTPSNLKQIDVSNLSTTIWRDWFKGIEHIDQNDFISKLTVVFRVLSKVFEEQLKDESVQKLINDRRLNYDLLIIEACVNPALILSHIFKAPVIQMSSFGANSDSMQIIGTTTHPLLYPTYYHRRVYNLTVLEKMNELYNHALIVGMLEKQELNHNLMLQKLFGNSIPLLNELKSNVHMLFLNVHPMWIHNQPVPPKVVYIWGIHNASEKPLPNDLQSYLDSSQNGAIYLSFGSSVQTSTIKPETLEILLNVFSRLPYNILWKWDNEEIPGKSKNIKICNWLPQTDVLRHPNLKLFITQGGLQSTDEAIRAGVPLIGVPLHGDQEYNVEKYEHFKIGIKLTYKSLTVENLENAIRTIFTEYKSYKKNIIHLRTQMYDQPKPPVENVIWWIEYVLRHGDAKHLQSPAANMSWVEYYELKLAFVLLSGLIILITLLLYIVYYTHKRISRIVCIKINKRKVEIEKSM